MPLRFLHTADWHLGKQLHKEDLGPDMDLFFEWMTRLIDEEKIDLLLVAGDIFDLANPANDDRRRYYRLLANLSSKCQIIITGGNHDSNRMLDAPSELLGVLNISVVGGIDKNNIEKEIIPIYSADNELEAVVLAVPYLRDADVRPYVDDLSQQSRQEALRQGIIKHYTTLSERAKNQYGDPTIIGMGHLWLEGARASDSEREVTVGNLDAVDYKTLHQGIDYLALGHIHRPQKVDQDGHIRYSGSPIPLSFSERSDTKQVLIGAVEAGKLTLESREVPLSRELRTMKGTVEDVTQQLADYKPSTPLRSLVELHISEDNYDSTIPARVAALSQEYRGWEDFKIIKERITYINNPKSIDQLYREETHLEDLKPSEVFEQILDQSSTRAEDLDIFRDLFAEVLQDVVKGEGDT